METSSDQAMAEKESVERLEHKNRKPAARNRPRRAAYGILLAAGLLIAGWLTLRPAWRETCRREAYLPQLEAEDRATPFDGRLLALLGGEYMQAGEYSAAADTLRHAAAAGEQGPLVWLNLAAATAASGDPVGAAAAVSLGLRAHPDDTLLQSARDRVPTLPRTAPPDQLARAIAPDGPDALVSQYSSGSFLNGVAGWWGRLNPDSAGFRTRQEWARETPGDARVNYRWGVALSRSRRDGEAVDVLKRSVTSDPRFAPARLALADALVSTGRSSDGVAEYLEALKLRPGWTPALLGAGKGYLAGGNTASAVTFYLRASAAVPNSADAWIGLGSAYRRTGVDHDKAVVAFRKAERLAPARTDFFIDYADALRQEAQWPAAEDLLARRLKAAPDDALAHYSLGMVMLMNNPTPERQAAAEGQTREALRLSPHNPMANLQLAQILLAKGQAQEAIGLLTDALDADPYNPNAMIVLARACRRTGKIALAEKISKKADALYQTKQQLRVLESDYSAHVMDPAFHEHISSLLGQAGETQRAMHEAYIANLLRADPRQAAAEIDKLRATQSAALSSR